MKKCSNIILIIILLTATGGLSVTRHYCGDSLKSFSFFSTPKPCCDKGCDKCHNESSFLKVTDEFNSSSSDLLSNIILSHFQDYLFIDLFESIPATFIDVIEYARKFLSLKTGDIPVSFGNFRC